VSNLVPARFSAVIFDMDGVLIDARDWHYRALNDALEIFDASIDSHEHEIRFDGLPTRVKLQMLTDEGKLPAHLHELIDEVKQERTLREAAQRCFPRVEHLLMMEWLKRQGISIGIATNSIRKTTLAMLDFAGLLNYLDVIVTNEDVLNAKPAPDIYLEAIRLLGVTSEQTLVVEDSEFGIRSAEAAGCTVTRVSGIEDVSENLLEPYFGRSA
jgi:beta-phosphoglucomutase